MTTDILHTIVAHKRTEIALQEEAVSQDFLIQQLGPADVRKLFYKVKHAQGTDITRTFCGLNDVRNIIPSIGYAHEAGMISQCSLCITFSPIHTVEYYVNMAKQLIEAGADEICIKDMAGIGRPVSLGKIVAGIKKIKNIPIQYHSHALRRRGA